MQKVPDHWYSIINYSALAISVLGVGLFALGSVSAVGEVSETFGLTNFHAFLANLGAIISGMLVFHLYRNSHPESTSLVTLALTVFGLLIATNASGSASSLTVLIVYLALFAVGAYGVGAVIMAQVTIASFFLLNQQAGEAFTESSLLAVLGGIVVLSLSAALWRLAMKPSNHMAESQPSEQTPDITSSQLIEAASNGIMAIDETGIIKFMNSACAKLVGWNQNDAIGLNYKSVFSFVDEDGNATTVADPITESVQQTSPISQDTSIKHRDGKIVELSLSVSPIGNQKSAVIVMRDVSEANRQQRQKEEFISTASHEMRTPVAAIEGYISLALNPKVSTIDDKARNFLNRAHESTQHLGMLFRDLLTASKSEDGRLENHPEPIDVKNFLEKLSQDLKFTTDKKGLALNLEIGETGTVSPLYYVFADQERLREVLVNIIDNAIKFTEKGSVTLGLSGELDKVVISVKDTGVGIAEEDLDHLFQKFYRIDNSKTRSIGGTGLGLFICRQIVSLYNGRIWAESQPGVGSTFFIQLPRLEQKRAESLINATKSAVPGELLTSPVAELAHQNKPEAPNQ